MEPTREPHSASSSSHKAPPPRGAPAGKADLVRRFLARFVDGLVAAVLYLVIVAIIPGYFIDALLGAIAAAAYLLVCDGLDIDYMRGRSLGKHFLNLRPERLSGAPMTVETSIQRNWMFALGYFSLIPFIGWIISLIGLVIVLYEIYKVLTDPEGRRWGDELAGTKVVETAV